jgi:hypothetical protein
LILVAEALAKTWCYIADAAHLDAVIIANPKVIYTTLILCASSVGSVCLQTKLRLERQQKLCFLKERKSISTVPHCKIQRIIRRITPRQRISCGYRQQA